MKHAIDLATSMIQRRVNTKFRHLQYMIVNDCLLPFTNRIISEHDRFMELQQQGDTDDSNSGNNMILPEIIQSASSTLSDCLQLIDDTICSICTDNSSCTSLTTSNIDNCSGSNNNIVVAVVATVPSDVRDAVHESTYRLVSWLANTFEILVGGDPSDYNHIGYL
jgi:hypothetical protein